MRHDNDVRIIMSLGSAWEKADYVSAEGLVEMCGPMPVYRSESQLPETADQPECRFGAATCPGGAASAQ